MRASAVARWLLAATLLALAAPSVAAHAELVSDATEPRPSAVFATSDQAPGHVSATFTERLDPSGSDLTVTDTKTGQRVDLGDLHLTNDPRPLMSVSLPTLPAGTYRVAYRALSAADGHPNPGFYHFAIGANATAPAASTPASSRVDAGFGIPRALLYAGLAIGLAGAAFATWVKPGQAAASVPTRALLAGSALHLAGLALLVRHTVIEAGTPLGTFLAGSVGQAMAQRFILGAAALVLALIATSRPTRFGPAAAATALALAGLGSAGLGHASTQGVAAVAIDLTHLIAASLWVGGLVVLAWCLWALRRAGPDPSEARTIGLRFGTMALVCVALVAATGLILSVSILGRDALLHPGTLTTSPYGALLLAKVGLAVAMVALAAVNRYVFLEGPAAGRLGRMQNVAHRATRGVLRPGLADGRSFGRTVAIEALLGVLVVVAAGFLTSVSPPQAQAAPAAANPDHLDAEGDYYHVRLGFEPVAARGAQSDVRVDITDKESGAKVLDNTCGRSTCLELQVALEGQAGAESFPLASHGDTWYAHGIQWGGTGNVTLTVRIQTADHFSDQATASFRLV